MAANTETDDNYDFVKLCVANVLLLSLEYSKLYCLQAFVSVSMLVIVMFIHHLRKFFTYLRFEAINVHCTNSSFFERVPLFNNPNRETIFSKTASTSNSINLKAMSSSLCSS